MNLFDVGDHTLSEGLVLDREEMNALKHLKDTPHGGVLCGLAFLVRDGLVLFEQLLA